VTGNHRIKDYGRNIEAKMHEAEVPSYETSVNLEMKIYPMECVYLAAYAVMDDAYLLITPSQDTGDKPESIEVSISRKEASDTSMTSEELAGEFMNELLRNCARRHTAKRNKEIRKHIIGRALASASPSGE